MCLCLFLFSDLARFYKMQKFQRSRLVFEENDDFWTNLAQEYLQNTSYKCRVCEKMEFKNPLNQTFYPRWFQSHLMDINQMFVKTLRLCHDLLSDLCNLFP